MSRSANYQHVGCQFAGPQSAACQPAGQRRLRLLSRLLFLLALAALGGCANLSWYTQAARGQLDILSRREAVATVIADPATPPPVAQQLAVLNRARSFAVNELDLPDNGSYRSYAELGRDAAVWTLVVTPELSLTPKSWCYPLVGCQSYRGYFKQYRAIQQAHRWDLKGYDSLVLATPAYSTLGWFDDPILDTMLLAHVEDTVGLMFHELTHQRVYVKGDTAFNEAYATWVERGGTQQWLVRQGTPETLQAWQKRQQWQQNYYHILQSSRDELARAYAQPHNENQRRAAKQRILDALEQHLRQAGLPVPEPLNNAQLAIIATYEEGVSRFAELFQCHNKDWKHFHAAVAHIAQWPKERRRGWLEGVIDTPTEVCHLTRAQHQDN